MRASKTLSRPLPETFPTPIDGGRWFQRALSCAIPWSFRIRCTCRSLEEAQIGRIGLSGSMGIRPGIGATGFRRPPLKLTWTSNPHGLGPISEQPSPRSSGRPGRRCGPRLWRSLWRCCEPDLAQAFALAVVTKYLGNTLSITLRHYVDPTDVAFR